MPSHRNSATTPQAEEISGRIEPALAPNTHQRKPSMISTIGLRPYQKRHPSDTTALENATGDTARPNWKINGMM
jgi:hypothetical protein